MTAEEKLEVIEKAILDLQTGKRVVSVQYGDTRVQYASVDLDALKPELWIRGQVKMRREGRLSRFDLVNDKCGNDMNEHIYK